MNRSPVGVLVIAALAVFWQNIGQAQEVKVKDVCGSPFALKSVLQKVQCKSGPPIVVFSQKDHNGDADTHVLNILETLGAVAPKKNYLVYSEGDLFLGTDPNIEFTQGLEVRQLKSEADMDMAFQILNDPKFVRDPSLFGNAKLAFAEAIALWPELLPTLHKIIDGRPELKDENVVLKDIEAAEKLVFPQGKFIQNVYGRLKDEISNRIIPSRLVYLQNFAALAELWIDIGGVELPKVKGVEFISPVSLDNLGYARSVTFVKAISQQYCSLKKAKTIWVFIGNGHVTETECLLKKYLPVENKVQVNTAEEITFE